MKTALLAAVLALATGSAALAQQDYPPCTHPGQDRCVQGPAAREGEHMGRHHGHHGHHHAKRHHHHRRHHHH